MTRRKFYIRLNDDESPEIDFKALVHNQESKEKKKEPNNHSVASIAGAAGDLGENNLKNARQLDEEEEENDGDEETENLESLKTLMDPFADGEPNFRTPRNARFNIIERLERRYGGGGITLHGSPIVEEDYGEKGEDDDLYDSEDSFIDDTELHETIEELHGQARVKTKHSGFFVNAGEEIETFEEEIDDRIDETILEQPPKKKKKGKKSSTESSKAVKAFLDEWGDAASEWEPGSDVLESIEALKSEVTELSKTSPMTKVFPRKLDDALRAVDKLVVESHPNKWRVNGYFATLMSFLPFTKAYLKTNMLRLEARDLGRSAKAEIDKSFEELSQQLQHYTDKAESTSNEQLKEEIMKDTNLAKKLYTLLQFVDEWVLKENEYRQLLKTEDKKSMEEKDYAQLNVRQERNKMFNRVHALFPASTIDLPSLRGLNRSVKAKVPRKSLTAKSGTPLSAAKSPVTARKKTTSPARETAPSSGTSKATPTASVNPAVSPSPAQTAKRTARPPKTRLMDDPPIFMEADFIERA